MAVEQHAEKAGMAWVPGYQTVDTSTAHIGFRCVGARQGLAPAADYRAGNAGGDRCSPTRPGVAGEPVDPLATLVGRQQPVASHRSPSPFARVKHRGIRPN